MDKKRGIEHIKKKKKYGRGRPDGGRPVPSTNAPVLDSNWDRYEQEPLEEMNRLKLIDSSTDFGILANAPITKGSHFQFRSDREHSEVVKNLNVELFNLDLNLLSLSVATKPFNIRNGIPDSYFTKDQLAALNKEATESAEEYKAHLSKHTNLPQTTSQSEIGISNNDGISDNINRSPSRSENVVSVAPVLSDNNAIIENTDFNAKTRTEEDEEVEPYAPVDDESRHKMAPRFGFEGLSDSERSISRGSDSDLEKWLDDVLDQ